MKPITKILHVSPTDTGRAVIICPQCKKRNRINVSALPKSSKPLKTRCGCGCIFRLIIDPQDNPKKAARLTGVYMKFEKLGSKEYGFFVIEELSLAGLNFHTHTYHTIEIGEILQVRFVLDNIKASEVTKAVRVKHVDGHSIQVEFSNTKDLNTTLINYLRAS